MSELEAATYIAMMTIFTAGFAIALGTLGPVLMEGKAAAKALEGMARQPETSRNLRTTLLISMALLESTAIYVLLVVLILLFANPLLEQVFAN